MAIAEKKTYSVDLQKGASHAVLRAPLATMDNLAHIFEVQVNDGGAAADLTAATCAGYFVRADGVTVALNGTVSGSTASVTLGANCYAVAGRFELAVKLTQGDVIHTILRVEGSVTTSRTDTMTGAGDAPGSGSGGDSEALARLEQRVNNNAAAIDTLETRTDNHAASIETLQSEVDGLKAGSGGGSGGSYVLPVATATRLGGVKVGNGLAISADGTLRVNLEQWQGGSY